MQEPSYGDESPLADFARAQQEAISYLSTVRPDDFVSAEFEANWNSFSEARIGIKPTSDIFKNVIRLLEKLPSDHREGMAQFLREPGKIYPQSLKHGNLFLANSFQLCKIIETFEILDAKDNPEFFEKFIRAFEIQINKNSPKRVETDSRNLGQWIWNSTHIIQSLAKMGIELDDLLSTKYRNIRNTLLRKASPADLAAILVPKDIHFLTSWIAVATPKLSHFDAKPLVSVLSSFQRMKVDPGTDFMDAWQLAAAEKMNFFEAGQLSQSLKNMAVLGHEPQHHFMASAIRRMVKTESDMSLSESAKALHAVCAFSVSERGDYKEIAEFLLDKLRGASVNGPSHISRSASFWFGLKPPNSLEPAQFDAEADSFLKCRFQAAGARLAPEDEGYVGAIDHHVSVAVEAGDRTIFIEGTRREHTIRDAHTGSSKPSGLTLFRTAVLRKACPATPLVLFDEEDYRDASSDRFLGYLVRSFESLPPGLYQAAPSKAGEDGLYACLKPLASTQTYG